MSVSRVAHLRYLLFCSLELYPKLIQKCSLLEARCRASEEMSPDAAESKQREVCLFCSVRSDRQLLAVFWLLCQGDLLTMLCLVSTNL